MDFDHIGIQELVCNKVVLMNMDIRAPKMRSLQVDPKTQNGYFLKIGLIILITFQHFMGSIIINKIV
jgi:hypothetical protein